MQRTGLRPRLVGGPAASQANGERVRGALGDLLDEVFMILEEYSVDPDLTESGDLGDAGL